MEFLLPKTRQIGKNLLLKDNTWMVTIRVPEDVKGKIGQSRLKKSLQTTDLALAERLKIHWLEQWRLQFDLIRDNPDISAMELGAAVDTFSRIVRRSELAGATPQQSFRETAILLNPEGKSFDEQKKLAKIHSQATGYGRQTKTIEYIDEFFEHQRYSKRVEIEASKYLNYIGQYWLYCQKQYGVPKSLIDYDSILPLQSKKTMAAKMEKLLKNEQYSDEQCYHLLDGAIDKGDDMLRDLIVLGMYTGCRLEELCQLRCKDVYDNGFDIKMSKTMAGIRIVPIHHEIQQLVERLLQTSKDGYLLSGLSSDNQAEVRSKGMSQKFSRLKQKLGYGKDKKYTFHSFRSSLCRRLENAGVDVIHAKRLVGHSEDSQTYGIYSRGTDWDIRVKEMNKAKYLRPASSSTG